MWHIKLAVLLCGLATAGAVLLATGKVCYKDLGCFTNEGEFNAIERPVNFLPESPDAINARYWLLNRKDQVGVSMIYNDEDAIRNSTFDPKKETKFLIHGYKSSTAKTWVHVAAKELLLHDDYNVFVVDWKRGAEVTFGKACANARVIGAEIAVLLTKLKELKNANLMTVHLIGSNVGAHVAGYAGSRLDEVGRITGLDPAAPYFENTGDTVHLDRTDAAFVDVIHTDTGNTFDFAFGMHSQIGHVDFYPNGGHYQPGCPKGKISGSIIGGIMGLLNKHKGAAREKFLCSHRRAEQLFIESINTKCPFYSFPCSSPEELHSGECLHDAGEIGRMGLHADKSMGRGVQMLETYDAAPFCTYHYQINVAGSSTINGKIYVTLNGKKGKTEPIDVAEHNKLLSPHEHYQKVIKTHQDVGEIESVEVKYQETSNLIKIVFDNDWKMESLKIFQGYTQKEYNFCVKDVIITSSLSKIFKPSDACP